MDDSRFPYMLISTVAMLVGTITLFSDVLYGIGLLLVSLWWMLFAVAYSLNRFYSTYIKTELKNIDDKWHSKYN